MFLAFLKMVGITTGIAWVLLAPVLYLRAEAMIVWGIAIGCVLPALCFISGFYAICWAFHRSLNSLMIAVFGGMLARLLFVGIVFLLLIKLAQLHVLSFVFSLFGFYILYMTIELYFVNSRLQRREEIQG